MTLVLGDVDPVGFDTDPAVGQPSPMRERLRRAAWPVAIVVVLLIAVSITVLANGSGNSRPLDPDGVGPDGAKALAQVLRSHGVDVEVERTSIGFADAVETHPTAIVLVSRTDLLGEVDLEQIETHVISGQRSLVLIAPSPDQLHLLAPGVEIIAGAARQKAAAQCDDPVASRAGPADAGGSTYRTDQSVPTTSCYPVAGHPSYVVRGTGHTITVVGQPRLLTNDRLAKEGDASLMVGLLGGSGELVWYVPTGEAVGPQQHSLRSLLPGWVGWVTLELFVAIAVCMIWRGRRLGRLVPEPLPVVVRAVETTEGRARMYRRARAQGRAAAQLRAAELQRLRERLGLPHSAAVADIGAVVESRTGMPARQVAEILAGPPPHDDAGLVRLAQTLDQLDREVRRS